MNSLKPILKLIYPFIFIFLFFTNIQRTFASHSMGADITYRCLGGNTYEISLSFYRDCAGIISADSALVSFSSSCFGNDSIMLAQIDSTGREISPICPSQATTCNGGTFTGIQEYVYRGVVTLPGACADWTFSFNLCCRNWAITNISQPGNTSMYIYATLNNLDFPNNNSPTFSNKPVPFVCVGQQFCFNHGAFDADGDSLVYQLIDPLNSEGVPVSYLPAYSASNPLSSAPAVTFNPVTGDICMTPTALEVTVMAVLVKEFRNGILIGTVERDIQVTVMNCNNSLPEMTGIDSTNNFSETICAGAQSCFTIYSSDADLNQNTVVSWDSSIHSAVFTVQPGTRELATFCWTPVLTDVRSNPYCFTVTVHDNNCPYFGSQTYSYCITVAGIGVNAGVDQPVGCNAQATLTAVATGGSGVYTYQWNTGDTTSSITSGPGTYVVIASDGMCTNKDSVLIAGGPGVPVADFSPLTSCLGTTVQFHDLATISGGTITSWYWDFGDGDTSSAPDPLHSYASTGNYAVSFVVESAAGCLDTLERMLDVNNNQPAPDFLYYDVCLGSQVNFTDQSVSPVAVTNHWWNFGDASTSVVPNPAHIYSVAGNYNVSLAIMNTSGCVDSVTHSITVHSLPVANAGSDQSLCAGNSTTLTATGGIGYLWSPGGFASASVNITPLATQTYTVTVTDANDCHSSDNVKVTVNPKPVADAGSDQTICRGNSVILSAAGGGDYLWSFPQGYISTAQFVDTPLTSTVFIVTVTNSFGCQSTDEVSVIVNEVPVANAGSSQSICYGDEVTLNGSGVGHYSWFPSGDTLSSITITPQSSTLYSLIVTNDFGCSDIANAQVTVNPLPVAAFENPPLVCFGSLTDFSNQSQISSGTITGNDWSFGNNTFSNLISPQILYGDTGNYDVRLVTTSNAGCRDTTNSSVTIAATPVVSFSANDVCFPDTVNFVNATSIISGEQLYYEWNLGDSAHSSSVNLTHNYSTYGVYHTSLIAFSQSGCRDTLMHDIAVHALPVAAFQTSSACERSSVQFGDGSSIPNDVVNSWHWDFGDTTISSDQNPSHIYYSSGLFSVQLKVESNFGCRDSVIQSQLIFPKPIPDFTADEECLGDSTRFTNLSGITTGSIVQWSWSLGDQQFDNSFAPVHLYANAGSYTVQLSVMSDNGCDAAVVIPSAAIVHTLPEASFTPASTTVEEIFPFVKFVNLSTTGVNNSWNFGDNSFSSEVSPEHVYREAGMYSVQLIITDEFGCKDTAYSDVDVKKVSSIFIPNAFTPNGDGDNDFFRPSFENMISIEMQLFDRWGKKVAEWSDLNGSWDGTYNGSQVPADVYVYRLASIDMYGKKEVHIGHVTVVR